MLLLLLSISCVPFCTFANYFIAEIVGICGDVAVITFAFPVNNM